MKANNEIFIQVRNIDFAFLIDEKRKRNLICPSFLAFFKEDYPPTIEEFEANQKAVKEYQKATGDYFGLPEPLKYYHFHGVMKEVGSEIVRCSNNKIKRCKAFKFCFEYEGNTFSELFFLDKSMKEYYCKGICKCAILGSKSYSKLME